MQLSHRTPDDKDRLVWKYAPGDTTPKADFGSPLTTTSFQFCIYDDRDGVPSLVASMTIPAGGTCGTKPCWKETGAGYKYSNKGGAPDGITALGLRQGRAPGKTRIQVSGRGIALPLPAMPLAQDPAVTVQLASSAGVCWQARYPGPAARNLVEQFKDK